MTCRSHVWLVQPVTKSNGTIGWFSRSLFGKVLSNAVWLVQPVAKSKNNNGWLVQPVALHGV